MRVCVVSASMSLVSFWLLRRWPPDSTYKWKAIDLCDLDELGVFALGGRNPPRKTKFVESHKELKDDNCDLALGLIS